jgi:hypothetical protein
MQSARDHWFPEVASPVDEIYFTSGDALGRMALSYKSLLADVYWIRAVQYFGGTRLDMKNGVTPAPGSGRSSYDLLYPLLDVATTLDPSFNIAYRFGATFLAEGYPNGPGRPDQAVALLDALNISRASVVGNSMGGRIAQRLAVVHPGRVARLVLIGAASPRPFQSAALATTRNYKPSREWMRPRSVRPHFRLPSKS